MCISLENINAITRYRTLYWCYGITNQPTHGWGSFTKSDENLQRDLLNRENNYETLYGERSITDWNDIRSDISFSIAFVMYAQKIDKAVKRVNIRFEPHKFLRTIHLNTFKCVYW